MSTGQGVGTVAAVVTFIATGGNLPAAMAAYQISASIDGACDMPIHPPADEEAHRSDSNVRQSRSGTR